METYEVQPRTLLALRSNIFRVEEVREPSNPLYPGLVFEGYYWDIGRSVWGRKRTINTPYGEKFYQTSLTLDDFPEVFLGAYLAPGDLAAIVDEPNGSSYWSYEVKCKVVAFGEREAQVKVTGDSHQFVKGEVVTVPTQRVWKRDAVRRR